MKSWEIEQMAREEGQKEGKSQINRLNLLLAESGRADDIMKAAADADYQDVLLAEFGLK